MLKLSVSWLGGIFYVILKCKQEKLSIEAKILKNRLVEAVFPDSEAEAQNTSDTRNYIRQRLKSSLVIRNGPDIRLWCWAGYQILGRRLRLISSQLSGLVGTRYIGKFQL